MSSAEHTPTRRTIVRGAAWSLPVLAVAIAAPAATASPAALVTYDLDGECATQGVLGFHGPAFRFSTAAPGVPAGTTIVLTGPGVASAAWNLNTLFPGGFPAGVVTGAPSGDSYVLTFTTDWFGGPVVFGAAMDLPALTRFEAALVLPSGYAPAPQADGFGWIEVSNTVTDCRYDAVD